MPYNQYYALKKKKLVHINRISGVEYVEQNLTFDI